MASSASLPLHTLAADTTALRLSPVDLIDEYLDRIERLEPELHAFVSVNARLAAEARRPVVSGGHAGDGCGDSGADLRWAAFALPLLLNRPMGMVVEMNLPAGCGRCRWWR
jgi:hypothetical protein